MTRRRTHMALVAAWLSLVIADTGRCAVLRGSIRDASTGQPVRLANLRVYPRGRAAAVEAAAENDGAFAFENLAAGVYSLCVMGGQEHLPCIVPDIEVHSNVKMVLDMSARSNEQSDAWGQGSWLFRAYYELGGAARFHRMVSAGQTFAAVGGNVVFASARLQGVGDGAAYVRFSIHESGPMGRQIGPSRVVPAALDSAVTWGPDEVPVAPGGTYYLHIETLDGGVMLVAAAPDARPDAHAVFNGRSDTKRDLVACVVGGTREEAGDHRVQPHEIETVGQATGKAKAGPLVEPVGKVKGNAAGNERGAVLFGREGDCLGWAVTGPSGLYEFAGIPAGSYMMLLAGRMVPGVEVDGGRTTVVDHADQPKLEFEKELWGPSRVAFAQSFVATGTAVTGFSLWRASGNSKLRVSLFEDSPGGRRIAGPWETPRPVVWVGGAKLPAEFATDIGRAYCLRIEASDGKPWNHSMPRAGDVYPDGMAFFDDVPHPESDLGITIEQQQPTLSVIAADDDLHYIPEGPGSGTCRVAAQTFIAESVNIVRAFANCGGWGGIADFVFSIHENDPNGPQIGPAVNVKMVADWGADVLWFAGDVPVTAGRQYCLKYRRVDGGPFFSYLSSDLCAGRAWRDGRVLPEQFDQLFCVYGESEADSLACPYDVVVAEITATTAQIRWRTGAAADSFVHFGTTSRLGRFAGDQSKRVASHSVTLTGLAGGEVYRYRVSSHTHKASSHRTFSGIYSFVTSPEGPDSPRFHRPAEPSPAADAGENPVVNGSFENGLEGWTRIACAGKKGTEAFNAATSPMGKVGFGEDGYTAHSGQKLYGFSYIGSDDPTWKGPAELWNRELITQAIRVTPDRPHVLEAWLLTGDQGSGWGRDARIRLVVDEAGGDLLGAFETADQANATQWFAAQHRWLPVRLRFTPRAERVVIGAEFLHWWALEASYLYIDDIRVYPLAATGPSDAGPSAPDSEQSR